VQQLAVGQNGRGGLINLAAGVAAGAALGAFAAALEAESPDHCAMRGFTYLPRPPGGGTWTTYVRSDRCGNRTAPETPERAIPHGHHIVMKQRFLTILAPVQQILCKHGIDPFGCRETEEALKGRNMVIAQNWCHTTKYAQRIVAFITAEDLRGGKDAVRDALSTLAREF